MSRRALLAAIALGGVVGSLGRYAVGLLIPRAGADFPWATLTVNLSGCLLMGLLVAHLTVRPNAPDWVRPALGVGVLGGWTTFSAFAEEVVALGQAGNAGLAVAYVLTSVVGGAAAVGAGSVVGQRVWPA